MMANQSVFNSTSSVANNDRLLVALFVAVIVHMIVVLGIRFSEPNPPVQNSRSIDVTLVYTPAKKAPKKAKFLAQDNQVGAGEKLHKPQPPAQRIASLGNSQNKQEDKSEQEQAEPKAKQKLITQENATTKVATEKRPETTDDTEKRPQLTAEAIQQQITQYGAEIRLKQQSSDQAKIKFANSVSAHQYVAAQYVKDWERKVERTGNLNYPAIAAKKNFSGALTMDVGIKADGNIYSMRISQSSGYPELDEAAKRIVKMSAPFPALPSDLLKELNVLVITRKWKFSDESGMTTP
ncbi:energy transducer TonB [Methyloglobulus sp.]|uniref:energy transducer TonB n=1 Tax=Methyloglobulus sp. TaxID=2518622 RepID=UPI00398962E3